MSPSKPLFNDLAILSTLALKGVLQDTIPGLQIDYHATQALLKSIADGASADVVILTGEGIDQLVRDGKVVPATRIELGTSGVGVAVRSGARKPDIGSLDAFKRTILAASSVAHSRQGWSGLYFAKLLERLGLVDRLKKRVIVDKGPVAAVIASGEAELGAQLLCELAPVPGIDIVGPLPEEVQGSVAFAAAVMSTSTKRAAAQAFLDFLGTAAAQDAMRKNLLTPAPRSPRRPG
ncbi:MAG: substrate-binding domain-containing protein [Betaproteobacteria bacterium]|nr:substrate-binding domain-containing protein [Betaproteobacteria bacterium]MBV9359854.1 substrate-binding domain-containing protein [Betaproteobacteria bacterium]